MFARQCIPGVMAGILYTCTTGTVCYITMDCTLINDED